MCLLARFGDMTQTAYAFWLYDVCDNYLELIKPIVGDTSPENAKVRAGIKGFWSSTACSQYGLHYSVLMSHSYR